MTEFMDLTSIAKLYGAKGEYSKLYDNQGRLIWQGTLSAGTVLWEGQFQTALNTSTGNGNFMLTLSFSVSDVDVGIKIYYYGNSPDSVGTITFAKTPIPSANATVYIGSSGWGQWRISGVVDKKIIITVSGKTAPYDGAVTITKVTSL